MLTSITIPKSVTNIGGFAFYNCSGLTGITIPNSVTSVGESAFEGCSRLKEVHISDIAAWYNINFSYYRSNPLYYARNLYFNNELVTDLIIPNGVTSIGKYAFAGCSSLTNITIPESVTSIGSGAFMDCDGLKEVNYNAVNCIPINFSAYPVFQSCSNLVVINIGSQVQTIPEYMFSRCGGLTSVTIPDGVTSIGSSAFEGCSGLEEITLPFVGKSRNASDYESIFGYIFGYTWNSSGTYHYSSGGTNYHYYIPNSLKKVIITDTTRIPAYAFNNCSELTDISISDSITNIGGSAFNGTAVYNDENNWINGVLYIDNYLIKAKSADLPAKYSIRKGTTGIADSAFENCKNLTSITVPDSVMNIGDTAFDGCSGLTQANYGGTVAQWDKVTIGSDNSPLTSLMISCSDGTAEKLLQAGSCGSNLYFKLYQNGELVITGSGTMTNWSSSSNAPWYINRSSIKKVTIKSGVTSIGTDAFYKCNSLTSVTIPDSVASIGNNAFDGCSSLTSVTIGFGVTSIGSDIFSGCSQLNEITYTGTKAQWRKISIAASNSKLNDLIIHCSDGNVSPVVASGSCGAKATYTLYKDGTLDITGSGMLNKAPWGSKAAAVKQVNIEDGITNICDYAFLDCSNLKSVTIPSSLTSIGDYAFDGCTALNTVDYAGTKAQWGNISIGSDNTPLSLITIKCSDGDIINIVDTGSCGNKLAYTLYSDGGLVIDGSGNMTDWKSASSTPWYSKRDNIKKVTIESGVTRIGDYAFYDCSSLTSVTIPEGVTLIGCSAFYGCSSLASVTVP